MDTFNDIVKASREITPIHTHKTDLDFFRIKKQRYLQHVRKFQNDDGNYTISHPIAMMTLSLAVETEQRNKHFMYTKRISNDASQKYFRMSEI
jgi:hypothetical protein